MHEYAPFRISELWDYGRGALTCFAQDAELHTPTHLTVESLTKHAESTLSTYFYLLLSLLNLSSSETFSHAASHLGVAQNIQVLLRALPYHASQGRLIIPAEITARHGVRQEDVFRRGGNADGISDAVFEFATVANDNLLTAREMFKQSGGGSGAVPRVAMPVFLYGVRRSLFRASAFLEPKAKEKKVFCNRLES